LHNSPSPTVNVAVIWDTDRDNCRQQSCENSAMSADRLDTVRRYLKAIEDGTSADIASLFAADVVMEQLPIK